MKSKALAVLLLALLFSAASQTQEKAQDRRKFLDPKTQVSDDPRRVVVKARPRRPESTLVLRGGRIFDWAGAAAREGTLGIVRNQIVKILAANSSELSKHA